MGKKGLFDQLLNKGQELVKEKLSGGGSQQGSHSSGSSGGLGSLGGLAAGGLSGVALMKLLGRGRGGTGTGSSAGKTALLAAGSAGIGALAWKTYKEWNQKQGNQGRSSSDSSASSSSDDIFASYAPAVDHDRLMLQAMIAAAKADGHIDERERGMIREQADQLGLSPALRQFITEELNSPLDPEKIARSVQTPEHASELYLMSLLVVDEQNVMEKNYLQELARQLKLAPEVVARLEQQVR